MLIIKTKIKKLDNELFASHLNKNLQNYWKWVSNKPLVNDEELRFIGHVQISPLFEIEYLAFEKEDTLLFYKELIRQPGIASASAQSIIKHGDFIEWSTNFESLKEKINVRVANCLQNYLKKKQIKKMDKSEIEIISSLKALGFDESQLFYIIEKINSKNDTFASLNNEQKIEIIVSHYHEFISGKV